MLITILPTIILAIDRMGLALKGVHNGLKFGCGEVVTLQRGLFMCIVFFIFRIAELGTVRCYLGLLLLAGPLEKYAIRIYALGEGHFS